MNLQQALEFATRLHSGQVDKAGQPYIGHINRVVANVRDMDPWAPEQVLVAAALHDVVEDCGVFTSDLFVEGVTPQALQLVELMSRGDKSREEYYSAIKANPDARLIKLADIADNNNPERLALLEPEMRERLRNKYAFALEFILGEAA